jgi:hypothetical protein
MKWHRRILLISLLFSVFAANAQKLECEKLVFDLNNFGSEHEAGLKVNAVFKVKNLKNDTLIFRTNVRYSFLGPQNLKADIYNNNGNLSPLTSWIDTQTATDQSGDIQLLKVLMPNKRNGTVQISYNVIGYDLFVVFGDNDNEAFGLYQSEREHVYPMNIPIKEVQVLSPPDSMAYFLSYEKGKRAIRDINLSFMLKNDYYKNTINRGDCHVDIYIPDTLGSDHNMQLNIDALDRCVNKLSACLPIPIDTDIIYLNWRDDKQRTAFGKALGNYVVCDIHFKDKDLLHELIHIYLPVNVKSPSKGEYFIKESIIEWLALFFSDRTIDIQTAIDANSISLYDVLTNNHTTWSAIYTTGPAIIQQIAAKYGEKKMANLIISFLLKNRNRIVNYDLFIKYISRHLPHDLVEEMSYLMSNNPPAIN